MKNVINEEKDAFAVDKQKSELTHAERTQPDERMDADSKTRRNLNLRDPGTRGEMETETETETERECVCVREREIERER